MAGKFAKTQEGGGRLSDFDVERFLVALPSALQTPELINKYLAFFEDLFIEETLYIKAKAYGLSIEKQRALGDVLKAAMEGGSFEKSRSILDKMRSQRAADRAKSKLKEIR